MYAMATFRVYWNGPTMHVVVGIVDGGHKTKKNVYCIRSSVAWNVYKQKKK